jgi:hypothetical protein
MVDAGTWSRLGDGERMEFSRLRPLLPAALQCLGIEDGFEFSQIWSVRKLGQEEWCISDGRDRLDGVVSRSRAVIEALFSDIVQNFNR